VYGGGGGALEALIVCSGNDASPQHQSVLRPINPLNPPPKFISTCSGGSYPIKSKRTTVWGARPPVGVVGDETICGEVMWWGTRGIFPPASALVGHDRY